MACITISRQVGSLGCQVARLTAECLGYRMVWRDLINQAAIQAGVPEVALATIDELGLLGLRPAPKAQQAYTHAVEKVMRDLADAGGVVIVGRAGQVILHGRRDTFHVRVIAPLEVRVERVARSKQVTHEAALAQVQASDKARRLYLRKNYQAGWDDPSLYDLVINTGHISPTTAAALICQGVKDRLSAPQSFEDTGLTIECE